MLVIVFPLIICPVANSCVIMLRYTQTHKMTNSVNIGRLSFSRDSVEKSRHGKVYRGLFDEFVDVSIVRVDTSEIFVDKKLLHTTDMHPNVVRFYGTEEDADGEFL